MKFIVTSTLKTMTRNMRVNVVVVVTLLVADLAFFPGMLLHRRRCAGLRFLQMKHMDNSIHYVGTHRIPESKAEHKLTETALAKFF